MVGPRRRTSLAGAIAAPTPSATSAASVEGTGGAIRAAAWGACRPGAALSHQGAGGDAASGEWVDAAGEVAIVLDMPLPEDFGESALEFDEVAALAWRAPEGEAVVEYVFEMPSRCELDALCTSCAPRPRASRHRGSQTCGQSSRACSAPRRRACSPLLFRTPPMAVSVS